MKPTREQAEDAIRTLISWIGDDPDRPGLMETPRRVLDAWANDWGSGYKGAPLVTTFLEGADLDQIIVQKNLVVFSTCEHHLSPFYGVAHIGYLPERSIGVIGISKLSRIVNHYSRRLQMQERLTQQIARFLEPMTEGVGVVLHCRHMCMISRGVREPNTLTTTSVLSGVFRQPTIRSEFLAITLRTDGIKDA